MIRMCGHPKDSARLMSRLPRTKLSRECRFAKSWQIKRQVSQADSFKPVQ
jgi:hypothetical protein